MNDSQPPNEQIVHAIVETMPAAVFRCVYDPETIIDFTYVSPQLYTLLNLDATTLVENTTNLWQHITEADQHNLKAVVYAAKETHTAWTWVMEYTQAGEEGGWLEWQAAPDPGDGQLVWNGVITDISSHMRMATRRRGRRERYQQILVDLARNPVVNGDNLQAAFETITETVVNAMPVDRTSIWMYSTDRQSIVCTDLYDVHTSKHTSGTKLNQVDFPKYFTALSESRIITANNAHTHPATAEFSEIYLRPLNIDAMLDASIRIRQDVLGVLCCENVGGIRNWAASEESFASSMGDLVALVIENQHRRNEQQAQQDLQQQIIEMQQAAIAELSTPIIPFSDDILLLPLIGSINIQRAQQIIDVLLEAVSEYKAQTVILDLTGVPIVDTQIATSLIRAAQSVQLLGARTIVTGIRPEIAQTLVSLGIDLESMHTQSNLQNGIRQALGRNRI